jgi:serine/threonine-protein kinase
MPSQPDPRSFGRTLRQGAGQTPSDVGALSGTLVGLAPQPVQPVELDGDETSEPASMRPPTVATSSIGTEAPRGTVLPRRRPGGSSTEAASPMRARFDRVRLLGEGGMGQVELARDNDIRRTVAVKRLKDDACSEEAQLRFADEVRIVGQLEHPAIVPIYDVGKDSDGQVYLVMKHLNGETMETIIERLRTGDTDYVARFPIEQRVHIFLAVLDAMRYAHARGIIHRDLKPANIIVGPYGEVTVLDWGIAKPIRRPDKDAPINPLDSTLMASQDARMQDTQLGALAGTPLYMSPEQAAGRNDELDERSDVYSLCVVLLEWLWLEHPRRDKKTLIELLSAIVSEDYDDKLQQRVMMAGVPVPYIQLMWKGLVRDKTKRLQSVAELEQRLSAIVAGRVPIECHVTLGKRAAHEAILWIDRHPLIYTVIFFGTLVGLGLLAIVKLIVALRG